MIVFAAQEMAPCCRCPTPAGADAGDEAGRRRQGSRGTSGRGSCRMVGACCFWRCPRGGPVARLGDAHRQPRRRTSRRVAAAPRTPPDGCSPPRQTPGVSSPSPLIPSASAGGHRRSRFATRLAGGTTEGTLRGSPSRRAGCWSSIGRRRRVSQLVWMDRGGRELARVTPARGCPRRVRARAGRASRRRRDSILQATGTRDALAVRWAPFRRDPPDVRGQRPADPCGLSTVATSTSRSSTGATTSR